MRFSTRSLARAAIIAALYIALTLLLQPISFGPVQFRVSEALTILPILTLDAVPGLTVGCVLANLLGGAPWYDVFFGSLATLLAALLTRKFRNKFPLAASMPVLLNGLITGPVVYFAYLLIPGDPASIPALLGCMGSVALGELAVVGILGTALWYALKKLPRVFLS